MVKYKMENSTMSLLMVVMGLGSMIGGFFQAYYGNVVAQAIFWVACAGFYIAASVYNLPIQLNLNKK